MTTVKRDPTKTNTNFLSMLPINGGCSAAQVTRLSPPYTAVLFGTALAPGTYNILTTDDYFGAAIISITGGSPKVLSKATIGNQKATCWAIISPANKTAFVMAVGINHIVDVDPANGQIKQSTILPNANSGDGRGRGRGKDGICAESRGWKDDQAGGGGHECESPAGEAGAES